MNVNVVTRGERGGGGSVVGVYRRKDVARMKALEQETHFGDWIEDDPSDWKSEEGKVVVVYLSGCDFVLVETFEVK